MSIKRHFKILVESALNVRIVRPHLVAPLFEEFHPKQVFERFGVDCVFDVGANVGQYAERLRQRVGYRGEILSYEPNPNVVGRLRAKAKGDPNWHIVEIALECHMGKQIMLFECVRRLPRLSSFDLRAVIPAATQVATGALSTAFLPLPLGPPTHRLSISLSLVPIIGRLAVVGQTSVAMKYLSLFDAIESDEITAEIFRSPRHIFVCIVVLLIVAGVLLPMRLNDSEVVAIACLMIALFEPRETGAAERIYQCLIGSWS